MKETIKAFKNWLIANGHTASNYPCLVNKFFSQYNEITTDNVQGFIVKLKESHPATTINQYLRAFSKYITFASIENVKLPKYHKEILKVPEVISLEYFEKEVIPMAEYDFAYGLKVKAILYFMFFTLARREEVVLMKRKDINLQTKTVKLFIKKRNREKIMRFSKKVKQVLEGYFASEPEEKNAFNISVRSIDYIFNKLKPNFKDINFTPHLLRKSGATHYYRIFKDYKIVQMLLGHSSQKTTERYINAHPQIIDEIYNKYID